jgi:hypothetical protein
VTGKRYHAVDIARTAALAGMVVFHFVYDLDLFGWVPRGTATQGWFWYHARLVAGSFIFLAGLSLWLAHGRGIRWSAFARRAAILALAAAAVTVATHFALPGLTIFYGILHSILVSSVVGLLFLAVHPPHLRRLADLDRPGPRAPADRRFRAVLSLVRPLPGGSGQRAAAVLGQPLATAGAARHGPGPPFGLARAALAGDLPDPPAGADRACRRRHLGRHASAVSRRSPCERPRAKPIFWM